LDTFANFFRFWAKPEQVFGFEDLPVIPPPIENFILTSAKTSQNPLVAPVTLPKGVQVSGIAAAISLLTLALAQQISGLELEVAKQLAPAMSDFSQGFDPILLAANSSAQSGVVQLTASLALSSIILGVTSSRGSMPTLNRVIVSNGIFLLSVALQLVILPKLGVMPLVITALLTSALSCASGLIMRQRAKTNKVLESQYYELKIRNRELNDARRALVERDEMERRILAADLHDQVLNDLKKIVEDFNKFEKDPENKAIGNTIRSDFTKTMNQIREIMDDLSPIMLQNFGLRAALEDCLDKGKERAGYESDFECDVDDDILDNLSLVQQSLLFRLVQESLTNIAKHARATRVSIKVSRKGDLLSIAIEDNGKGIDYENISHQSRGLRYMKLRADLINALVEWKPGRDNKGTRVIITRPMDSLD
jgi:signal transduction histidine kinase